MSFSLLLVVSGLLFFIHYMFVFDILATAERTAGMGGNGGKGGGIFRRDRHGKHNNREEREKKKGGPETSTRQREPGRAGGKDWWRNMLGGLELELELELAVQIQDQRVRGSKTVEDDQVKVRVAKQW